MHRAALRHAVPCRAVADERPHQFLHMPSAELEVCLEGVKDSALRHCLQFGIGLHHAGLGDKDRALVERLYVECKIQVGRRAVWGCGWGVVWCVCVGGVRWCVCVGGGGVGRGSECAGGLRPAQVAPSIS